MFYFGIIRFNILQVKQNATHLSQHDSTKGANAHEMTLCIAYGALRFWSCFASWPRSCDLRRRERHAHEVLTLQGIDSNLRIIDVAWST